MQMKEEPEGAVQVRIAVPSDVKYVYPILEEMDRSAKARGTGIAKRTPQSLCQKIYDGKAVIAVAANGEWAGFSYIEVWSDGEFVSNSGLIVNPAYRNAGVARAIKQQVFALSREYYPDAKIFSITTGAAILKMNSRLGFEPVIYADITQDDRFWDQCKHCVNHAILEGQAGSVAFVRPCCSTRPFLILERFFRSGWWGSVPGQRAQRIKIL
jgi:hypothetical protein